MRTVRLTPTSPRSRLQNSCKALSMTPSPLGRPRYTWRFCKGCRRFAGHSRPKYSRYFFMRSGFTHPALIVSWQRKSANSASTGLTVEWSHLINSHKTVPTANDKGRFAEIRRNRRDSSAPSPPAEASAHHGPTSKPGLTTVTKLIDKYQHGTKQLICPECPMAC